METCTVETGLLKKKPCGQPSTTHCANCEQALCAKHAIAQLKPNGLKSGKFMCKECDAARKQFEKDVPPAPPPEEKKPAEAAKAAAPAAAAQKPAAAAPAQKAAAPAAKAAAPAAKPEEKKPDLDDSGPLEFTPSKPKAPEEKK
jgi:hypothetical protein